MYYWCRPTVAGIHGGPEGAYSIALSGGYDDNIDLGEGFTYTGEGWNQMSILTVNSLNYARFYPLTQFVVKGI